MGAQCLGRAGFRTINDGRVLDGGTGATLSQVLDGRRKEGVDQLLVDGGIAGGRWHGLHSPVDQTVLCADMQHTGLLGYCCFLHNILVQTR